MNLGHAEANADLIQLVNCEETIVDTTAGSPNVDEWIDDVGEIAISTAPVSAAGESIARSPDGSDSDDAGGFVVVAVPTPGGPFMVVDDGCAPSTDVKINEVLANPDGADGGNEWIELYNAGADEVSLADWKIQGGTRPSTLSEDHVFGAETILAPGGFLVIGESGVASADVWVDALSLGNAGENADIVQLVNCDGDVADTLVYGSPNEDEWIDDSGALATSLGPVAPSGQTIARRVDGLDSDSAGEDFGSAIIPTPGETNEVSDEGDDDGGDEGGTDLDGDDDGGTDDDGGPVDESDCPGATSIKLNEVLVDPEGSDGGYEWIELFNAGSASVNLDGWSIEGGTSSVSTYVAFEGGMNLAPGEYLLVGDTEVADADVVTSINMGNAGSNADIVRLVDCSDVVVDTLVYGSPNDDEWLDDSGTIATSWRRKRHLG